MTMITDNDTYLQWYIFIYVCNTTEMELCCLETFHLSERHVNGLFASTSALVISMCRQGIGSFSPSLLLFASGSDRPFYLFSQVWSQSQDCGRLGNRKAQQHTATPYHEGLWLRWYTIMNDNDIMINTYAIFKGKTQVDGVRWQTRWQQQQRNTPKRSRSGKGFLASVFVTRCHPKAWQCAPEHIQNLEWRSIFHISDI